MDDDLGTPAAVAVDPRHRARGQQALADGDLEAAARQRGVGARDARRARPRPRRPALGYAGGADDLHAVVDALVRGLLEQRAEARANKDFAAADAIRDQIKAAGIEIEDTPERPEVERGSG